MYKLYSTGNYIQYPLINHNGKDYEKVYIYITKPLFYIAAIKLSIVNQLYFNKIRKRCSSIRNKVFHINLFKLSLWNVLCIFYSSDQIRSDQSLSHVRLFVTP